MRVFQPDYRHVLNAAWNIEADRLPLYEHIVSFGKIDEIQGTQKAPLFKGDAADLDAFFAWYCGFFQEYGYDIVPFECCIGAIMPGSGALGNPQLDPVIQTPEDFEAYPWDALEDYYFQANSRYFEALRRNLPPGMRAVGGVGNGVFECVQDLVGFENLCYLAVDEPEMYAGLFQRMGRVSLGIWKRFLREFADVFCVLRFGDDLGYKSMTLLSGEDIKAHIIPQYARIIAEVHSYHKPFLLHSCGKIEGVMDALIEVAHINAKHSNEDQIAPFPWWVETYGERIGNFGGIDTDAVCRLDKQTMREYITEVVSKSTGHGGFAFGSGNSIPDYVPAEGYLNMIEIVRELRGDTRA